MSTVHRKRISDVFEEISPHRPILSKFGLFGGTVSLVSAHVYAQAEGGKRLL